MKFTRIRGWSLSVLSAGLLSGTVLQAQTPNMLATAVQNELLTHTAINYQLFDKTTQHDAAIDREINDAVYLKLNKAALEILRKDNSQLLAFSLPLGDGAHTFMLNSFNILDNGFKVYTRASDGKKTEVQVETGVFYRGILEGQPNSLAAFTFSQGEVAAVFSTVADGNYNLVLNYANPGVNRDNYVLFKESDVRNPHTVPCGVTEAMNMQHRDGEGTTAAKGTYNSCHKLRVSMHGDYKLFQARGSVANSVTYLTNLFNVISALYNNEGINAVMSEAVINNVPDGYTYTSSNVVLDHFGEAVHSSYDGDIAQLVSGYNENGFPPLGGLAWLDVLCQAPAQFSNGSGGLVWVGPFSIVDNYILNSIPQLPVYSWDAEASTHEMGHSIGSPHTQSCSWPGGPIDNCVPVEDGTCSPGPAPAASGGTIMSYCHLTSYGINFAFGFGPLPGNLIRTNMANRSCLSSFKPVATLTAANTVRIANRQCTDGQWSYFYYDNNTASETDDELLLMLNANGQNIGNVDVTGVQVKMTTQAYGSNTGRTVAAPYAASDWKEANRTWSVTLPSGTQPSAKVTIRFPFTNQDVLDIKGSIPALTQANQLTVVAFNNQNAANSPATAAAAGVTYYNNAGTADTAHWKLGTEGNYSYAEFVSNYGLFGGSLGKKASALGIQEPGQQGQSLEIYPNPATSQLNISIPQGPKSVRYEVTLFDPLGRMVLKKENTTASGNSIQLNISGLAAGVYNIRYTNDGTSFNAKFVKK